MGRKSVLTKLLTAKQEARKLQALTPQTQRLQAQRLQTQRLQALKLQQQKPQAQRPRTQKLQTQRLYAQSLEEGRPAAQVSRTSGLLPYQGKQPPEDCTSDSRGPSSNLQPEYSHLRSATKEMGQKFFVVWRGRKVGVFDSWEDYHIAKNCRGSDLCVDPNCKIEGANTQVHKFKNGKYKGKFKTEAEATKAWEESDECKLSLKAPRSPQRSEVEGVSPRPLGVQRLLTTPC